ncbi:hypothetical protein IAU59_000272 [Kwoniella sp. CBS 9459]
MVAGRHRLEDVSCAICMDPLFTKRDDLDDLVPIATCDCGHVLHEPCLLEWFRTQSTQYLAQAREHGIEGRHGSPTLSDAPAECPTCRAECYADPETGQPSIHRLYIDWGGVLDNAPGQTQAGSSPMRSMHASGSSTRYGARNREVLGLARRAKGVTEEAKTLGAESNDEEMEGMLKRAKDLERDCLSVKALEAVKTYVGSLSRSLDRLDQTLTTYPLIPGLKARNNDLEQKLKEIEKNMRIAILRETKKARDEERSRSDRKVREAENERDVMQKHMMQERTARKRAAEAYDVRKKDLIVKLDQARDEARKEKEAREDVQNTLNERMNQLKALRSSAESRKALRTKIEQLQAENDRLQTKITTSSLAFPSQAGPSRTHSRRASSQQSLRSDNDNDNDEEESILSFDQYSQFPSNGFQNPSNSSRRIPASSADDSLQVDMPSFLDISSRSDPRLVTTVTTSKDLKHYGTRSSPTRRARPVGRDRPHPTARTIIFEPDEDEKQNGDSKRRRKTHSKYWSSELDRTESVEKGDQEDRVLQELLANESSMRGDKVGHGYSQAYGGTVAERAQVNVSPTPCRRRNSDDDMNDTYETIPESETEDEPKHDLKEPLSKRSKTNPFATTRQASEKRKELPSLPTLKKNDPRPNYLTNEVYDADKWKGEVIDLASSSPPVPPRFLSTSRLGPPRPMQEREPTSAQAPNSKVNDGRGQESTNTGFKSRTGHADRLSAGAGPQSTMVDFLGLRDANGRPKKGVVSGHQKLKRRA